MSAAATPRAEPDAPLTYALRWRVSGVLPGAHPGMESGHSGRFRDMVPFDRSPDPRRIDLRSTARDPFGVLHVRRFEQRAAARVEALVDVSASMRFGAQRSHFDLGADLVNAVAQAAYEIHDALSLALCGAKVELSRRSSRRAAPTLTRGELASFRPGASSARGLIEAAGALVGRRRLVFLISDFAYPLSELAVVLDALTGHDVVPVHIFDDPAQTVPRWGLTELTDLESGRRRFLVLRPSLLERWKAQSAERRASIAQVCATRGRRPFVLQGRFSAFALADYLLAS